MHYGLKCIYKAIERFELKFLDKIERKHPRWGIENLMLHICILTAVVYVMHYALRSSIIGYLYLDRDGVFSGQVWRLVSFVFIPEGGSLINFLIWLSLYYFIGNALESTWGTFKFNAYYAVCMLSTVAAALLFGGKYTGTYINLSLFLAFAMIFPEYQLLVFFILPVKVKYLAYLDAAFLLYRFVMGSLTVKLSIAAAMLGFLLIFGGELIKRIKAWIRRQKYKNKF